MKNIRFIQFSLRSSRCFPSDGFGESSARGKRVIGYQVPLIAGSSVNEIDIAFRVNIYLFHRNIVNQPN